MNFLELKDKATQRHGISANSKTVYTYRDGQLEEVGSIVVNGDKLIIGDYYESKADEYILVEHIDSLKYRVTYGDGECDEAWFHLDAAEEIEELLEDDRFNDEYYIPSIGGSIKVTDEVLTQEIMELINKYRRSEE